MKLMRYLGLSSLKSKLFLKPCRKMMQLFSKLPLRKPVCIRSLRFRRRRRFSKRERELDRATELTSFTSEAPQYLQKAPHPSPLTPAYVRTLMRKAQTAALDEDRVAEDACRSFEKYLMDMLVDEKGKMRDLADVEELLYCWKELRSPVFLDLVCRFYRELCTDLFSTTSI